MSKDILARDAGTYQFSRYTLEMVPEHNHLLVKYDNGGTLAVFPESETKFFAKPWAIEFEFLKERQSRILPTDTAPIRQSGQWREEIARADPVAHPLEVTTVTARNQLSRCLMCS